MDNKLNRREILERMAMVTGGAVSLTIISACDNGISVPKGTENLNLKALNKTQFDLVGDIADAIIPDTNTLGAKSVNVHYLVDELAANWMMSDDRDVFLNDLTALDSRIKSEQGKSFSELDQTGRGKVLDQLGAEMIAAGQIKSGLGDITNSDDLDGRKHIYLELRELIIFGYYTSEVGASEELSYNPIPGRYDGCIPLADVGGKAWSL
ncbi:MAG: gluconate 2-dehydrogenase subunit 3 family protein [Emcibacteraceae bacterium]|nr:gluconate 2-dehydrogenase subunit 3 family protein [Emcibacteraceae bacterium]MDG1859042.1 gluconate 2-dehydrogenase subunit 3 family protein [Emcibacteraceae bacterium]